ncbi:MAG: cob(I)yrinic acid a,c-diamide adenosyltransferase [Desulfobulbaceae bacterium]|nr:cob(I)yrinic acid a,c-diamide adenosyltransferase [Desulfobulbaceae bacterium]
MESKGIVIVNTGDGKGKTTAAFGQVLRAVGHGFAVCIIQFIKGKWQTGEVKALATCSDLIELHVCGTGFTWDAEHMDEVKRAARQGWELARAKIISGNYKLVVLDEITYLLNYGFVAENEVLAVLEDRPPGVNIVLTGRGAGAGLVALADIVTEMREIKHCYGTGVKAGKGVEF